MKKSEALNILGLKDGASDDEVKQAHRSKVRANHPDRFTDPAKKAEAEEQTKLINEARDVLLSRKWDPEFGPRTGGYGNPYGNPYTTYRPQGGQTWSGWPGSTGGGTGTGGRGTWTAWPGGFGYSWTSGTDADGQGNTQRSGGPEFVSPFDFIWQAWGMDPNQPGTGTGAGTGAGSAQGGYAGGTRNPYADGFNPFDLGDFFTTIPRKTPKQRLEEAQQMQHRTWAAIGIKAALLAVMAFTGNLAAGMFWYAMITLGLAIWRNTSGCSWLFVLPAIIFFAPMIGWLAPASGTIVSGVAIVAFVFAVFYDVNTVREDAALVAQLKDLVAREGA